MKLTPVHKLSLLRTRRESANAMSFFFKPPELFEWQAGQFLKYWLPDGQSHYFTIASPPYSGEIQITTRLTGSEFKRALQSLKVGDTIDASVPDGDFVWANSSLPKLWLAGGIGVTPFHSILLERDFAGEQLNLHLIYANRTAEVTYQAEFEDLASRHSELQITYLTGEPLTLSKIRNIYPAVHEALIYLSGPEPMVEVLGDEMRAKLKLGDGQLKQDFFPNYNQNNY